MRAGTLLVAAGLALSGQGAELRNAVLRLELGADRAGVPVIRKAVWTGTGRLVFSAGGGPSAAWRIDSSGTMLRAEADSRLDSGLTVTRVLELARKRAIIRAHTRFTNTGRAPVAVATFPAWQARWRLPAAMRRVRWWDSLTFREHEQQLGSAALTLASRLHSSEDKGANPYWVLGDDRGRLYFGLEWCGGWEARMQAAAGGVDVSVELPAAETQLTLQPGESIDGPAVLVSPAAPAPERVARARWMSDRAALATALYGGPALDYPLVYNHWYSVRWQLTPAYFKAQLDAMAPYRFDAFVVDAGWYARVGQWEPDAAKFAPGEFEASMRLICERGLEPGIWSCPQFVWDASRPGVEHPVNYRKFIDGYLLDLAGCGFTRHLLEHVKLLRERYAARWWKYDQDLFAANTRAGVMKNVAAFQQALVAVRRANPELIIENCQSGGRMLNELTLLATDAQWLRDGGRNGLPHARENIATVLGAMEFVFPRAAFRWTNNLDKMDPRDAELTRYYCRSAMAGLWGISSDLSRIPGTQREVILKEIALYRRLSAAKREALYDLAVPREGAPLAGVTFYRPGHHGAAVLLYRWDQKGDFTPQLVMRVKPGAMYRVEDVDTGSVRRLSGAELRGKGVTVVFPAERLSAVLIVDPA